MAAALIVLIASLAAMAQAPGAVKYAKSSEVKVKGTVAEVKTGADGIVHLAFTTDKGSLDVFVAPEKFLKEMEIAFNKGDALEIVGSQVTAADGTPLLLAREITRAGDTMLMRDDQGKPVWVGWPK
ncbi:MAG: hypothetical protein P4M01_07090 [Acidobacteriota bacterium]|nr:hypothetical protein [Acidobacteriota bacterium]